jgi:hypothetical protein
MCNIEAQVHLFGMLNAFLPRTISLIVLAGLATSEAESAYGQDATKCLAVSDSLPTPDTARLTGGTYTLEMVATAGAKPGAKARGTLTLVPTLGTDRSPRTRLRPRTDENRRAIPFWGYIDADLLSVGAPLPDGKNADEPQPHSRDPIYPGVLVHIQNWGSRTLPQQIVLLVGTSLNARVRLDYMVLDGPGILMKVRQLLPDGFLGTWHQGGRLVAGGYFCAFALH